MKMGRNYKNDREDWVYVEGAGNDKKRHFRGNNYPRVHRNPKPEGEETQAGEKKEEETETKEPRKESQQFKQETVEEKKQ